MIVTKKVSSLHDHKSKKKAEQIALELEGCVFAMSVAVRALTIFKKYQPVMEALSSLQNNKTLIEVHLSKYKRMLEEKESSGN